MNSEYTYPVPVCLLPVASLPVASSSERTSEWHNGSQIVAMLMTS